jgi:glycosyltransferase involved in cell wall biosynthesis
MNLSVVIPTYNSSRTIQSTLNSVLKQTLQPEEILVLDDGSSDNTVSLLSAYHPRVTVFHQENKGVASARNTLCRRANSDLVAFLDHDDVWHPRYLEIQAGLYHRHPQAVAMFTGHTDFFGYADYEWKDGAVGGTGTVTLKSPLSFLEMYNTKAGLFGSASFFCVPKKVLLEIGPEPFQPLVSGVDDSYLCTLLPLYGPVVYLEEPLVAYRIIREAQSTDKVKAFGLWVKVFEILENRYTSDADPQLRRAFQFAFASKRRQFAKRLFGVGRTGEGREQLYASLRNCSGTSSIAKTLGLLLISHMPRALQPRWPAGQREWKSAEANSSDVKPAASQSIG